MTAYDDDRVIALLRDSVPPVPDAPDRVSAVRHRAGRQRAAMWTQGLGAVASVLLVVGLASAVAKPGGRRVEPTANPLVGMAEAYARQGSVSFEVTSTPIGTPEALGELSAAQMRDLLTGHLTGAVAKDGDARIDGDVSMLGALFGLGDDSAPESHLRVVDGILYRSVRANDRVPAGKKWVQGGEGIATGAADIDRLLRAVASFGRDVEYVRQVESRGVALAEYRVTLPDEIASQPLTVTFAVDSEGLPRWVVADLSIGRLMQEGELKVLPSLDVHLELELFGYGEDVRVDAPPAAEVVDELSVWRGRSADTDAAQERLRRCVDRAPGRGDDDGSCFAAFRTELTSRGCTVTGSAAEFEFRCAEHGGTGGGSRLRPAAPGSPAPSGRPSPASVESPTP